MKKRKKMTKTMAKAKARKRQKTLLMKECRQELLAEGGKKSKKKYTKTFNPEIKIDLGRGLILTSTRKEVLEKLS